ncbi:MAG: nucleoside deaminase [Muribaculum sp.]|nr:nucleoside deaminase [Muribaculaceae bacterium]MCM1081393.1 nucleoside deaminase [Muribaculum sp.]
MIDKDEYYMKLALAEAGKAMAVDEVPIGAVVVCDDIVVGRGHNMTEALNDVTAHAEMQAITAAAATLGGKYLKECTLYVTVEPCLMCAGAIAWSQISRVVYGAPDPKRGYSCQVKSEPFHPKAQVVSGVMAEECGAMIRSFFAKKR